MSRNLKNISSVAGLTIVSRITGLVRDSLAASAFGTSLWASAFYTAFGLPNLFRRLLGEGALTAAFVPMLQEEMHEAGRPAAFALLNKVVSRLILVTGGLSVLAMLCFSQSRLIPGMGDKWYLAADLSVILFPYLAFVCIAAAFNATLNVMHHFVEPALSPIWLNLAMIASLGAAIIGIAKSPLGEVHWWCAGVLAGGFLQMAVPAGVLMRQGWRPRFDLVPSQRVKEIAMLMLPGLFGTAIYQINIFVSRLLAFSLSDSAASTMFFANRVMEFPIGVFAIAVSTVVYPLIARHAVEKNFKGMADDYRRGIRMILAINVPAAAGLAILSEPIVRVLFQHGQFKADSTQQMAPLLMLFAVGMPFFSVVSLTVRAFYAVKDTKTPVRIATVDFCVNLILSFTLSRWMGVFGLVLASTVSIMVQMFLLQRALARKLPDMHFSALWPTVIKVLLATGLMALVVAGGWHSLQHVISRPRTADWLALLGLIPAGLATYALALWLLRIEGREEFEVLLGKFVRRKNPSG